jgi:hypothetical protein
MTTVQDEPSVQPALRLGEASAPALLIEQPPIVPATPLEPGRNSDRPAVPPLLACACAALAASGGGWMLTGAFAGYEAHLVAVGAAVLGGLLVALSYLTRRPGVLQALVLPLAALAGAIVAAPGLSGGPGSLPSQVSDALREGGLSAPPVAFDPGWRFLLVVLVMAITATAATAALWLRRGQIAVLVPLPLLVAGVLVQPPGKQFLTVCISLVFVVAALSVAYGAQLAQEGVSGAGFELRRFLSAAAIGAVLVGALVGVGQVGGLLPTKQESQTIPPRKPQSSPPAGDQVVITVKGAGDNPVRLGVLDVYQDGFWLTPPYNSARLVNVAGDGTIAPGALASNGHTAATKTFTVTIDATDLAGRALPDLAGTTKVAGYSGQVSYDPRTQSLQTDGRIPTGATYTVTAPQLPDGDQLAKAPNATPGAALQPFLQAPAPPYAVQNLLLKMPHGLSAYARLAYLRQQYYSKAVAAGPGNLVPVSAQRVAEILAGQSASPYEIAAGEVLLARWAGIPARLGYGYFGGQPQPDGSRAMHATDGAMWLEAYFPTYGWVPIVGRPQHARPSLSANQKNSTKIQATDQLGADLYVPVQLATIQLIYTLVRYWSLRVLPWAIGIVLLLLGYPGLIKYGRRLRRRWWARRHGPLASVLTEYAELRDYANDLNVGHPTMTPLEFLDAVQPDEWHTELAWLVSRALWGDLSRDLRAEDAHHAAVMARSVRRRLFAGQPLVMRLLAFGSRVSLREPYTDEVPNLWFGSTAGPAQRGAAPAVARPRTKKLRRRARAQVARLRQVPLRRLAVRVVVAAAVLALFTELVLTGGVRTLNLSTTAAQVSQAEGSLPKVPPELAGVRFQRESSAEQGFHSYTSNSLIAAGRLYALRLGDSVVGTIQFGVFKPTVRARGSSVHQAMLAELGKGVFSVNRLNSEQINVQHLAEVSLYVWFSPDGRYYELITAKNGYDTADELLVNLLNFQRTGNSATIKTFTGVQPIDSRRGAP